MPLAPQETKQAKGIGDYETFLHSQENIDGNTFNLYRRGKSGAVFFAV